MKVEEKDRRVVHQRNLKLGIRKSTLLDRVSLQNKVRKHLEVKTRNQMTKNTMKTMRKNSRNYSTRMMKKTKTLRKFQ